VLLLGKTRKFTSPVVERYRGGGNAEEAESLVVERVVGFKLQIDPMLSAFDEQVKTSASSLLGATGSENRRSFPTANRRSKPR
jgi:hypothetical protein